MDRENQADALLRRALSFIAASETLVGRQEQGYLISSLLLQGFAAELIAKKRLYEESAKTEEVEQTEKRLRSEPYAHNILKMWRDYTDFLSEALSIDSTFEKHFIALDSAHTKATKYAIRYGGEMDTPDPRVIAPVLKEIIRRERMRRASAQ